MTTETLNVIWASIGGLLVLSIIVGMWREHINAAYLKKQIEDVKTQALTEIAKIKEALKSEPTSV